MTGKYDTYNGSKQWHRRCVVDDATLMCSMVVCCWWCYFDVQYGGVLLMMLLWCAVWWAVHHWQARAMAWLLCCWWCYFDVQYGGPYITGKQELWPGCSVELIGCLAVSHSYLGIQVICLNRCEWAICVGCLPLSYGCLHCVLPIHLAPATCNLPVRQVAHVVTAVIYCRFLVLPWSIGDPPRPAVVNSHHCKNQVEATVVVYAVH